MSADETPPNADTSPSDDTSPEDAPSANDAASTSTNDAASTNDSAASRDVASMEPNDAASTSRAASTNDASAAAAALALPSRAAIIERALVLFFGEKSTGESAALFRFAFGLLSIWTSIGVWLNLDRYFSNTGLAPWELVKTDAYAKLSFFSLAPDSRALLIAHAVVFSASSLTFTIGLFPRLSTLIIAIVNVSLQYRNPFILNSGDRLFQIVAALAVFMPLAQKWSVSAALRRWRKLPNLPGGTVFGARLIQLELAYVYMSSFIAKVTNPRWREGIALRDVLSSPVFAEWPHYFARFPIVGFLTYMTLAFELLFPLLVWFKRTRPWFLLWGIAFHEGIDVMMVIPMFSAVMIVCYPSYLTDAEASSLVDAVRSPRAALRGWLEARRARRVEKEKARATAKDIAATAKRANQSKPP